MGESAVKPFKVGRMLEDEEARSMWAYKVFIIIILESNNLSLSLSLSPSERETSWKQIKLIHSQQPYPQ